ncbi:hypothetical protein A3B45_01000 [Candidatus Daviesbacteria bacterium RIFCSPLOWO2_01_FULL_39_12]|uniref:Type II secretion system protein GspG C-terminal domain-containing protein n=1 Tax=Candidatus Daviesbacteria bacterium RIFCSPLOWO2_01_FULL_39_12 TaxID=1797785 RepID=A0A1F5KTA1_9BACT|nr:MAG: hypothetical protein A3D79_02065 [Candidatus Daviesbacteria bacterium RIFCSPHIGHO2_02_FULL_39_8]OGE44153.1 MAG: hypothetical protein A3B45_01000 [Candidatus Daviesbacteria bacterium RIFCSPLOWO2_01_FULL_39_12]
MKRFLQITRKNSGFTLIELLVVIGILVVLLAIVLIAINPGRQFGQANDTKRRSDVNAILNAIGGYAADNKGALPAGIPDALPAADVGLTTSICEAIMPNYISAVPADPTLDNDAGITNCTADPIFTAGYTVIKDANNRVTVNAPSAENPPISVTR